MHGRIKIEIPSEDGLGAEVWEFALIDTNLVLDEYRLQRKPSRRHRTFEILKFYTRIGSTRMIDSKVLVPEADVPWPEFVRQEAMRKLVEQFKVVRWKADLGR